MPRPEPDVAEIEAAEVGLLDDLLNLIKSNEMTGDQSTSYVLFAVGVGRLQNLEHAFPNLTMRQIARAFAAMGASPRLLSVDLLDELLDASYKKGRADGKKAAWDGQS